MKFKSEVQLEALNNATVDTDKFLVSDSSTVKYRTGAQLLSDLGIAGTYVPYTGATGNVDLGTHTLSSYNLIVNHTSGSGVAASITKGGSGEALTINKTSGSGNAMSVTGGLTSLVDLTLSSIANATIDTDRFLVSDSGTVKYRTGTQLLSDIGGQAALTNPITGTGTLNYVSKFTGTTTLGNSQIFDNSVNVGIGTASPSASAKFHVLSSFEIARFQSSITTLYNTYVANNVTVGYIGNGTGVVTSGSATDFGIQATNNFVLSTGGATERMRITSTGNVGIGTTSPSEKLHVVGNELVTGTLEVDTVNNGVGDFLTRTAGGIITRRTAAEVLSDIGAQAALTNPVTGTGTLNYVSKFTSTGSTLGNSQIFDNGTNVGIGTASPGEKLEVQNASLGAKIKVSNSAGGYASLECSSNSSSVAQLSFTNQLSLIGGNVGIGTTSPSAKLNVSGDIHIGDYGSAASRVLDFRTSNSVFTITTDGTSAALGTTLTYSWASGGGGPLKFNNAGGEVMRLSSAGNVGIGTTSPDTLLHISSFNSPILRLEATTTALVLDSAVGEVQFEANDASASGTGVKAKIGAYSDVAAGNAVGLRFFTAEAGVATGTEKMRISATGNVGIGTASGGTRLYVDYTTNGSDGIVSRNLSAGTSAFGYVGAFNNLTNGIDLRSYSSTHASLPSTSIIQSSSGQTGGIVINQVGANPIRFQTNSSERIRILSTGEVGIGTTAPSTRLQVVGGSDAWTGLALRDGGSDIPIIDFRVSDNSTRGSIRMNGVNSAGGDRLGLFSWITGTGLSEVMSIKGGGNVGIGTTTPSFPLSFGTGLGNKIALYDAGSGNGYGFGIQSSLLQIFSNASGDDITFGYGNSTSMVRNVTFKGTGNVGIGTTAPVDKLDVNGSIRFRLNTPNFTGAIDSGVLDFVPTSIFPTDPQIRLAAIGTATVGSSICFLTGLSTTVAERMRITTAGNVGIGISNPVAKLDVFSSGTVQTAVLGRGLDGNFRLVTAQDVSTNADQSVIGLIGLDYITTPNAAVRFHRGGSTTGGFISFTTNDGSERMRITSAGAMGLGVTPTNTAGRFEASNDIVAYSSSDRRWKTNIKNIDSPLEKISQINGVEFDWIEDEPVHGNKGHDIGVIAQEIENILPDAVQTRESGMKAVKYEKVIPLLIEAIKEQQKQIEELKQLLNGITN
jgi:hypothetical protein